MLRLASLRLGAANTRLMVIAITGTIACYYSTHGRYVPVTRSSSSTRITTAVLMPFVTGLPQHFNYSGLTIRRIKWYRRRTDTIHCRISHWSIGTTHRHTTRTAISSMVLPTFGRIIRQPSYHQGQYHHCHCIWSIMDHIVCLVGHVGLTIIHWSAGWRLISSPGLSRYRPRYVGDAQWRRR